jgi:hypothetical protein
MRKKWVAVIPCGKESINTIQILKSLNYNVIGIDLMANADAISYCDKTIICPINDIETILLYLQFNQIVPEYFFPVVSDKAIFPAYMLNNFYGLVEPNTLFPCYYSKVLLRTVLQHNHLPHPHFHVAATKGELRASMTRKDLIFKPDDSSGSRGITILKKAKLPALQNAFQYAMKYSRSKKVIIEDYIPGNEYMVDCFLFKGKIKALLVSEKKKIKDKVATLIFSLNPTEFDYEKLRKFLLLLSGKLCYLNGPLHIELKYHRGTFYILDFAARGGGFEIFNYYDGKILGFDFPKANIEVFLKNKLTQKCRHHREGLIYFILPSQNGAIKDIQFNKKMINDDLRFVPFYRKGAITNMEVTDGYRLAAVYCFADNKPELFQKLELFKKSIKLIYQT